MLTSHNILQKYYYDPDKDFNKLRICYIDRGAMNDVTCVIGDAVKLETYYFTVTTESVIKYIPYHRILGIDYEDVVLFRNNKAADYE